MPGSPTVPSILPCLSNSVSCIPALVPLRVDQYARSPRAAKVAVRHLLDAADLLGNPGDRLPSKFEFSRHRRAAPNRVSLANEQQLPRASVGEERYNMPDQRRLRAVCLALCSCGLASSAPAIDAALFPTSFAMANIQKVPPIWQKTLDNCGPFPCALDRAASHFGTESLPPPKPASRLAPVPKTMVPSALHEPPSRNTHDIADGLGRAARKYRSS